MPTQTEHTVKKEGTFFYLLFLTVFFLLLEISFFIQSNKTYLADFSFVSNQLRIPIAILPSLFYFIFAQLLIHFLYCVSIWLVVWSISKGFKLAWNQLIFIGISAWALGIITILTANQYFFPNSRFADLTATILPTQNATTIVFICLLFFCFIYFFLAFIGITKYLIFLFFANKKLTGLCLVVFILASSYVFSKSEYVVINDVATEHRPNIILIGIDSLRPDFLSFFGYEKTTPFFDTFLSQATVFSEAVTPLARTFPSWTSILLGEHPKKTGIRFNLAMQTHVDFNNSLPAILQRDGYETVFATDETRFSNIDKNFGFNRVITPPIGLNDFLIGTFNDFPLSNLLINTTVGKWLFPYSYANRPVYFSYQPDSFLNLLHPLLKEKRTKPLFMAVHFCLPHFPYLWAGLSAKEFSARERYAASIKRVDQQVGDFFALMKQYHLLDHAIIVLLSDHGEALELPGDRITEKDLFLAKNKSQSVPAFYPPSLDDEEMNQSAGHGTDVLGLSQYHSLLAFRTYGAGIQKRGIISGIVSLLDVKPTILQMAGVACKDEACHKVSPYRGTSLAAVIKGHSKHLERRPPIILESDYSPEAIRTVYPETRKVMLEGVQLFQIDPHSTRLTVKEEMGKMIINSKQYADIDGEWMLALYPQSKNDRMPILVNLKSGKWTNDLQSAFALKSPALSMLSRLKTFYGEEINNISP